jgi:hypothetical protein
MQIDAMTIASRKAAAERRDCLIRVAEDREHSGAAHEL